MLTPADIEQLIARTALKDRKAFSALYDATSAKLFGVCLSVLRNRAEAEEAVQDVYIRIWNKADRYAVTGHSPMTWLIAVARNLAIDRLRARKVPASSLDNAMETSDPSPGPEASAIAGAEARRVLDCMDELDADKARAVKGAYLNGDTYQDLATRFDVPLNTMRTWLRRSLAALRACLTQ